MPKIDRYLMQSLRAPEESVWDPAEESIDEGGALFEIETADVGGTWQDPPTTFPPPAPAPLRPLLVRLAQSGWTGEGIPDLVVTSRVGTVASCRGTLRSIDALAEDPAVVSVEASRPLTAAETDTSLPFVRARDVHRPPLDERGDQAIVAVLESGIDVLHEAFRDDQGRTRIRAVWDQSATSVPPPPMGYGTLHTAADIQGYIDTNVVPPSLGRDGRGHGTHVASIAAGRPVGNFKGGIAPEAGLLVVKTHRIAGQSVGYSHNHVDGLAWIGEQQRRLGLPVVLNLSQGMNAGAHDGTSLLELTFDQWSEGGSLQGLVAVKSAGNDRQRSSHAYLALNEGEIQELRWKSKTLRRHHDLLEVWHDSSLEVELQVESPSQETTPWISVRQPEAQGYFATGDCFDLDLDRLHQDNGDSRILIRLQKPDQGRYPEDGTWILRTRTVDIPDALAADRRGFHLWIERLSNGGIELLDHIDEGMTLSVPGTAHTVISVSSVESANPLQSAATSALGPTRDGRPKPDICAPGVGVRAAMGGTASDVMVRSGTSMAAPHVAGALALLLSRRRKTTAPGHQLNAAQARAALRNTARPFDGGWDSALGYGSLDTEALLTYVL